MVKNNYLYFLVTIIYIVIRILTINNCFFWDNIQQVSKEAHWFYLTNFRDFFISKTNVPDGISATGYHAPLMGMMTALLWKILGYKLWVHHLFIAFWAIILSYNIKKMLSVLFPKEYIALILTIILLESTLLSQFAVSSPDFILFTAFVIALRAIIFNKKGLLTIAVFFLCCINMRGVFAGIILYVSHQYYLFLQNNGSFNFKKSFSITLPYIPTFIILTSYYTFYLISNGWFFSDSSYSTHYMMPESFFQVVKHLVEFTLRSVENGRIVIWILSFYFLFKFVRSKTVLSHELKAFMLMFILFNGLYLIFVFISRMPFSSRYFLPQFFLLTVFTLHGITTFFTPKKIKLAFMLIIFAQTTGHLWIYPDKIAKPWDTTLGHLTYYDLREECFEYIDANNINYNDISAGFCLYGNRRFIELINEDKIVHHEKNRQYFLYSNISNVEDELINEFEDGNKWQLIKTFKKGFVFIKIYKNLSNNTNNKVVNSN